MPVHIALVAKFFKNIRLYIFCSKADQSLLHIFFQLCSITDLSCIPSFLYLYTFFCCSDICG